MLNMLLFTTYIFSTSNVLSKFKYFDTFNFEYSKNNFLRIFKSKKCYLFSQLFKFYFPIFNLFSKFIFFRNNTEIKVFFK